MENTIPLKALSEKAQMTRTLLNEMVALSVDFPAVHCNAKRILAALKMVELNLADE
jgi:hypothetical protein